MVLCMGACGHDGSPVTPVPSPGPPQIRSLQISGNASLTRVGETSQLTAKAIFTDSTTQDVTAETRWLSSEPSVVTVSPTGLLTVVRLGASLVTANYMSFSDRVTVRPTPAGTFVLAGWVREPGQGGVSGVRVTDAASLMATSTESDGQYALVSLPRAEAHLRFEKDGYEPADVDATQLLADASMQRTIRLHDGDTVNPPRFAPNDFTYMVGSVRCFPCRLIRLVAQRAGTFQLHVTWEERAVAMNLFANGSMFPATATELVADVPVAAGETVVYLGLKVPTGPGPVYHVPFTIEASLR
jgi:Bacterial Ig-like domain (group 2)